MSRNMKKQLMKGGTAFAIAAAVSLGAGGVASACSAVDQAGASGASAYSTQSSDVSYPGSSHSSESNAHDASYSSSDSDELYVQLDAALREHAPLSVDALRGEFLKAPDTQAILDQVDQNSVAVAGLVDQAYPGVHDEFLSGWRAHITYYQEYLRATANGDEAGRAAAKQKLVQFTVDSSNLLANYGYENPEELQQSMAVHGEQVTMIIDNLAAGNYGAAWQLNHEAYEHMGMLAEMLAYGSSGNDSDDSEA